MTLSESPFFARLARCRSVLIAGAGGGFDIYAGVPLLVHLRNAGQEVHLANLSFTQLANVDGARPTPDVVEVTADAQGPAEYFPERALARWLRARGHAMPIYAFSRNGCRPLLAAYRALKERIGFDAVVLVDGGTDILMRGDEAGLGTPQEDITSLAAVSELDVSEKFVACLGFGVDRHHGVCHAHFLEDVAALQRDGAFLGVTSLLPGMPEADAFREAVRFGNEQMPRSPSIVANSVASAIDGHYGDHHRTRRTQGSTLWINPLMSMYWAFDLMAVARRCLYLDQIKETDTPFECATRIEAFRNSQPTKPWQDIPV